MKRLVHEDQKKYILEAIDQLNEEEKVVLQLYYLNEYSLKEICNITGLTSSNVKIKLHRGRKRSAAPWSESNRSSGPSRL